MIETILVPIDIGHSDEGAGALALAKNLVEGRESELVLLNVVERMPDYIVAQLPEGLLEKAREDAAARLEEIARRNGVGEAKLLVREGRPWDEILQQAEDLDADLIVLASHDPKLSDYLLGSVAARVVRHAHCSVLVARNLKT